MAWTFFITFIFISSFFVLIPRLMVSLCSKIFCFHDFVVVVLVFWIFFSFTEFFCSSNTHSSSTIFALSGVVGDIPWSWKVLWEVHLTLLYECITYLMCSDFTIYPHKALLWYRNIIDILQWNRKQVSLLRCLNA